MACTSWTNGGIHWNICRRITLGAKLVRKVHSVVWKRPQNGPFNNSEKYFEKLGKNKKTFGRIKKLKSTENSEKYPRKLRKIRKNRKKIEKYSRKLGKYKWDLKKEKRSSLNFGGKIRKNTENSEKYSTKLGKIIRKIRKNTPENYEKTPEN